MLVSIADALINERRIIALDNIIKTRRWIFVPMVGFSSLANDGRSVSAHLTVLLTWTLSFIFRCIFRKTFKELESDAVEKLDFSDSAKAVLSIFSFFKSFGIRNEIRTWNGFAVVRF